MIPLPRHLFKGGFAMRRAVLFIFFCGVITLVAAPGCKKKEADKTYGGAKDGDVLVLEYEEIDLIPGEKKEVKVKSGKAETAEAPEDSKLTTKVEDKKVTVAAAKDAKEGTHEVTVKGGKKEVSLKVNVKKKSSK
jgi:hypothetical protein